MSEKFFYTMLFVLLSELLITLIIIAVMMC